MLPATAVITAYNAERYISRAIRSALTQSAGPMRVIVVDDASSDKTAEAAKACGGNVQVVRLPDNRGPAVGRTVGLQTCKSEFVAFLDADDYWMPDFVGETLTFLEAHPQAVAVFTGFIAKNWEGLKARKPVLDDGDELFYGERGRICPNFYQFWAKYMSVRTGTVMMRRDCALRTEGQRADLRLTQDLEFWAYLATFGPWGFIPKPLFVTDQQSVTPGERLAKLKRRYGHFRTMEIEDWAKRVRPRLEDPGSVIGFELILHRIALTIIVANAYTFRARRSYTLARRYRDHLGAGLGRALRLGVTGGPLFWPVVCLALRSREFLKAHSRFSLRDVRQDNCD